MQEKRDKMWIVRAKVNKEQSFIAVIKVNSSRDILVLVLAQKYMYIKVLAHN